VGGQNVPMRVTLYADYCDWPLWAPGGQLDPSALPLSDPTKRRIIAWLNAYDNEYRWDVAPWQPTEDVEGDADEAAWVEEGEMIRTIIQDELGPGYEVVFET
jgi:hypothetical protein